MGNIYLTALDILRRDGWRKNGRGLGDEPKCLIGALDAACGHTLDYEDHLLAPLNQVAKEQFSDRWRMSFIERMERERPTYAWAVDLNDHVYTTFEDIEMIFEKAAQTVGSA